MTLNDPPEQDDRRAAIEAAFEAAEATEAPEAPAEPVQAELPGIEPATAPEAAKTPEPEPEESKTPEPAPEPEPDVTTDRAPQAWKAAEKAKWATLDPEIRREVLRRETEITRTLNETAQARQFAQQFHQAVQPYMARVQSLNQSPVQLVEALFKADHILSTAPKNQRAQFVAQLISDYDIDVLALDAALSGKPVPDPVDSRVEQLLQQRLAPFNNFIQQQEAQARQQQELAREEARKTVAQMASDPKYPHFEAVRETMADLVDFYATKKNIYLSPEEAYNKAVMTDPVLSQQIRAQTTAATQIAQAQRAKKASVSVSGAPRAEMLGSPVATDRRAIIEAAFAQHSGR